MGNARGRWVILCTCFWRGTGQAQGLPLPVWGGGIGIAALLCKAVMRRDEDVDGQYELFAYDPANGVAPFGPVVQGCGDEEEIDVAVGAGVAAGVAAEEDDLLRVEFFGRSTGPRPELSPCR